jgi:hypothetical protein
MAEDRLGKDEIQCAAGHLKAALDDVYDEWKKGRINELTFKTRLEAIKAAGRRFKTEYRTATNAPCGV